MEDRHGPDLAEIERAVQRRKTWGTGILQDLIAIDSVAPHEAQCQERLAQILYQEGLPVELLMADEARLRASPAFLEDNLPVTGRPNLVAYYGQGDPAFRSLILNSHIDTEVWAHEAAKWTTPALTATIRDGRLYGRGAVDAKGQVMAAVMAIVALRDLGYVPAGQVMLQSVFGEEPSGNGTLALVCQDYKADAAIVLEPTQNHIAYGHRGILDLTFRVQGSTSHAAVSSHSVNAIAVAGYLCQKLDNALADWTSAVDRQYGPPSLNVGRIAGGESIFSRPQQVQIDCGIRYAPGTKQQILDHVLHACESTFQQEKPGLWQSISTQLAGDCDAAETLPDHPFVSWMLALVQRLQLDRQLQVFPGGCDARHFINRCHMPTVIFGPGSLHSAHAVDEFLPIDEWVQASVVLAQMVIQWCDGRRIE